MNDGRIARKEDGGSGVLAEVPCGEEHSNLSSNW